MPDAFVQLEMVFEPRIEWPGAIVSPLRGNDGETESLAIVSSSCYCLIKRTADGLCFHTSLSVGACDNIRRMIHPLSIGHRKKCRRYNNPRDAHFLTFSCFRRQPFLSRHRTCRWLVDSACFVKTSIPPLGLRAHA
jgi:hypothetical protein